MRFAERTENSRASPFGLVVRATSESAGVPFPGWRYCPEYFRPGQCFHIGANSDLLVEPLCVCMPLNLPLPDPKLRLANPQMTVTEVRISVPVVQPSETLEAIGKCERISLQLNEPHRLELVFNEGETGTRDMTPDLPLVVRW